MNDHKRMTYRIRQASNYVLNQFDFGGSLSWVYIYGHHRGGTSYTLNQFMKASRRGCGDWMLYEFAEPFIKAKNRQRSNLDMTRMYAEFRKNLLKNANVGGGYSIDITVKQATGRAIEVDFLSEVFKSEPVEKIFVAREPHGWWSSAKKKFNFSDSDMITNYRNGLQSFFDLGGVPILYGADMPQQLADISLLSGVEIDEFSSKNVQKVSKAMPLEDDFNHFVSRLARQTKLLV